MIGDKRFYEGANGDEDWVLGGMVGAKSVTSEFHFNELPSESPAAYIARTQAAVAAAVSDGDDRLEAKLRLYLCPALREFGQVQESITVGETGLAICVRLGMVEERIRLLIALSGCYLRIGDPARSFSLLGEVEAFARAEGTRLHVADVLNAQSATYGRARMAEKALDLARQVEQEYWQDIPPAIQSKTLNNISASLNDLGRYEEALPYADRGLAILASNPDIDQVGIATALLLGNRAVGMSRTASFEEVLLIVARVEEIAARTHQPFIIAGLMEELGVSYMSGGWPGRALSCFEKAKAVAIEASNPSILRTVSKHLAEAYAAEGRHDLANAELGVALRIVEDSLRDDIDSGIKSAMLKREAEFARRESEMMREARDSAESASRAKTEFLANVSHEIRTPLNGVLGVASLLLETDLTVEQRQFANLIRLSGDALLGVIGNVLDISKIEAGKLTTERKEFDFGEMCEDVAAALALRAHEKGVELNVSIPYDFPARLVGDEMRLRQVLINLIGNATKFTDEGEITVRVLASPSSGNQAWLRLEVIDTGIGIPKDRLAAIFESFTQADGSTSRRFGGTGLGLSISEKLIELMGGRIGVESQEGIGSAFWFELELERGGAADPLPPIEVASGKTIAVVGENMGVVVNVAGILVAEGFGIQIANQPSEVTGCPDLLVVDATGDFGGLQRDLEEVRTGLSLPTLPYILLTRVGATASLFAEGLRPLATLLKPVRRSELRRVLRTAFAPEASLPKANHRPEKPKFKPIRVLVAEDNEVNQLVANRLLASLGATVVEARDGSEAVRRFSSDTFDLIFMDCQMPVADGFEATMKIRDLEKALMRRTPIVAMTANASEADRDACLACGMDDFLSKPVTEGDLRAIIMRVLHITPIGSAAS